MFHPECGPHTSQFSGVAHVFLHAVFPHLKLLYFVILQWNCSNPCAFTTMHCMTRFQSMWITDITVIPQYRDGTENFLSPTDAIAVLTLQCNTQLTCLWQYWCRHTYCAASVQMYTGRAMARCDTTGGLIRFHIKVQSWLLCFWLSAC